MSYQLGRRSLAELVGVDPQVTRAVSRGIQLTAQDFAVHDGLRQLAEQREYVRTGVSKTLRSYHLPQPHDGLGKAVDLVPYVNGKLRWEWPPIYEVARALHAAARREHVLLRWGAVWDRIFNELDGDDLEGEAARYVERRRAAGLSTWQDGPHYELYDEHHHRWRELPRVADLPRMG